MFRNNNVL